MRGIHRSPVNSLHKRPVTRKMFPFHDVIMFLRNNGLPAYGHLSHTLFHNCNPIYVLRNIRFMQHNNRHRIDILDAVGLMPIWPQSVCSQHEDGSQSCISGAPQHRQTWCNAGCYLHCEMASRERKLFICGNYFLLSNANQSTLHLSWSPLILHIIRSIKYINTNRHIYI